MWGNYLTLGFRSLMKNGTYAFINIAGLALGLAACLLLLLYVRYETSYDAWLPDAERVYQLQSVNTDPETGRVTVSQGSHGVVAAPLKKDFPQIEYAVRADVSQLVLTRGADPVFADVWMTEPDFFQILRLPFLRGDPATALNDANALVLSRSEAIRLFGSLDVVGQTITNVRRGKKIEKRITGVFENLPKNSHLDIKNVGRISEEAAAECSWSCINGGVYVKLRPGTTVAPIHAGLPAWEKRNIPPQDVGGQKVSEGDRFDWKLVNVRDVHLSGAEGEPEKPTNDRTTIVTFTVIALLILGIASANFVNLATARAGQRAREVALRKVLGASRKQLLVQFLGESLLLTAIAMLIALSLAELVMPWLSAFLNADLKLAYLGTEGVLATVVGLWLAVGLAGGLYPAFFLSRFQPGAVLKANRSNAEPPGTGRVRSALVVAQFAVSIGLIACTIVIYAQTQFVRTNDAGYRREGLFTVSNMDRAAVVPVADTIIREAQRIPGVQAAAGAAIFPASGTTLNAKVIVPGRAKPATIGWYSVSPEFFETVGTKLLAGRTLSSSFANDAVRISDVIMAEGDALKQRQRELNARGGNTVVNRTAARQMGFADPASAIGKTVRVNTFQDGAGLLPLTIVGVVEDSRFRSMREPPEPMMFYNDGLYLRLVVRYESDNPEAVRQSVGRLWKRLAPDVPYEADYAEAELAELYRTDRARGISFAGFSLLAVVIAALGLFGLAAFTADRRTKEIGIRKVFGATVADIVRLLAWQFSKPVILANLIAWPVAWWIMRDWLNQFDARIALTPGPFVVAGLLALIIAVGTVSSHAIRIARTNPIHALRYE
ncbi:ABC transporter permease [Sphingomonas sp.]|uniref:ABC transporter permease n=1 Tax=Sphingomonas sp. TaxID=28214 RepID=UPI002DE24357|nr:ABC transporter permease [Sphingomonas sp.]